MASPLLHSPKFWIILGVSGVVLGGTVWGVAGRSSADADKVSLPKELTVEGIKAQMAEPGRAMTNMRSTMERPDLTDEQRRQAAVNMREAWQSTMRERMEEYFTASEEEKTAVLDRHIDEFQAQMKAWEEQRKKEKVDEKQEEERMNRAREMFGARTQQERKASSESRNPDQMAQTITYFMAVRQRMSQRGIQMPAMPGGGNRDGRGGRVAPVRRP